MYRYRCGECHASSTPVRTLGQVYAVRDMHRDLIHGGLVPDGEQILQPRTRADTPDWRIALLVAAGAAASAIGWLIHHL